MKLEVEKEAMATGLDQSGKKTLRATALATLVIAVLLLALTRVSGAEAGTVKVVPATTSKKSWGSARASKALGTAEYGRPRQKSCDVFASVCLNVHVPGMACCGSSCVDLNSHSGHCGGCSHICQAGRACCNGECKSVSRDRNHCGACNKKCPAGLRCAYGLCGY